MRHRHLLPFLLLAAFATPLLRAQESATREYIVISGGPSLIEWEKFKKVPHDHWWANFVRAARIRLGELRERQGETNQTLEERHTLNLKHKPQ
jgi:hypothetical protein